MFKCSIEIVCISIYIFMAKKMYLKKSYILIKFLEDNLICLASIVIIIIIIKKLSIFSFCLWRNWQSDSKTLYNITKHSCFK